MVNLHEAKSYLKVLIARIGGENDRNEAQTRFHIIDHLVEKCFGWEGDIEVEKYESDNGFTDYELGDPRKLIIEAKREGVTFEIPAGSSNKLIMPIRSLLDDNLQLKGAMEQAQGYSSRRGVPLAVVTNGHQYIGFLSSRIDGIEIFNGSAVVFHSLEHMYQNFTQAWNYFSKNGIDENRLSRLLSNGDRKLPNKLSSSLVDYPRVRYPSEVQASLKQLSELLIQDVMENGDLEKEFYKECYCESGALNKYTLLSKNILKARYAAILSDNEKHPSVLPVNTKKGSNISPSILSEALSKRPIVLIGDVGVGKSSFVKNLILNSAQDEFKNAIYVYIDLGSNASLNTDIEEYIQAEIENQLLSKYDVDIQAYSFIHGVYDSEIRRFSCGLWGDCQESNPSLYKEKLNDKLVILTEKKTTHLKRSVEHLSKGRKKQVIICIDNADQRSFEIQQNAFIISQELAKEWNATVFLSVRPQTFYKSKRSGALTAYPHKIFTISPPRVDMVIAKRLEFASRLARGEDYNEYTLIRSVNFAVFLDTLIFSLERNSDLKEFLANITGGNIRAVIEFVIGFIGSPNVEAQKIIDIVDSGDDYIIPLHEFTKQALLGDYSHYSSETSISMNIFDVITPDSNEHFLVSIIISYLDKNGEHLDNDGFCRTETLIYECQNSGFTLNQIEYALRRTTNKKLIETSLRVTFEEDEESNLIGEIPDKFRVTTIGAYHVKKWLGDFAYLDAMLFDTPILDTEVRNNLSNNISSLSISERYQRTIIFRDYLKSCWRSYDNAPPYLNFEEALDLGEDNFNRVKRAINKIASEAE